MAGYVPGSFLAGRGNQRRRSAGFREIYLHNPHHPGPRKFVELSR